MSKFDVQRAWDRAINSLDHLGIQRDVFDAIETIKALEARIAKLERVRDLSVALLPLLDNEPSISVDVWEKVTEIEIALAACDDGEGK